AAAGVVASRALQNLSLGYWKGLTSYSSHGRLHGSTTHIVGRFPGSWSSSTLSDVFTTTSFAARTFEPAGMLARSTRMSGLRCRLEVVWESSPPPVPARPAHPGS